MELRHRATYDGAGKHHVKSNRATSSDCSYLSTHPHNAQSITVQQTNAGLVTMAAVSRISKELTAGGSQLVNPNTSSQSTATKQI